jgi:hypothetical protein
VVLASQVKKLEWTEELDNDTAVRELCETYQLDFVRAHADAPKKGRAARLAKALLVPEGGVVAPRVYTVGEVDAMSMKDLQSAALGVGVDSYVGLWQENAAAILAKHGGTVDSVQTDPPYGVLDGVGRDVAPGAPEMKQVSHEVLCVTV